MTRGNFVGICDGTVYISPQFNGDMYPSRNGKFVQFLLSQVMSISDLEATVRYFDKYFFGYLEEGDLSPLRRQDKTLDFSKDYIKNYNSDYLYVKNIGSNPEKIIDRNGEVVEIMPGEIQVWNFGEREEDDVPVLTEKDRKKINFQAREIVLTGTDIRKKAQTVVSEIVKTLKEKIQKKSKEVGKETPENFVFLNDVFFANTEYFLVYDDVCFYWDGNIDNEFSVQTKKNMSEPILLEIYKKCIKSLEEK